MMKTSKVQAAVSIMGAVLGCGPVAQAQSTILFDNLSGTTAVAGDIGTDPFAPPGMGGDTARAQSFTTDGQNWTFESVTLGLAPGAMSSGGFTVHLYSDSGSGPGTQLGTLVGTDNPDTGLYSYTGAFDLNPNSTYWVEAEVSASYTGTYTWNGTGSAPTVGSGSRFGYSLDGGTSWGTDTGINYFMQVSATPTVVPEPPAMALVGLGSAALLVFRRRK